VPTLCSDAKSAGAVAGIGRGGDNGADDGGSENLLHVWIFSAFTGLDRKSTLLLAVVGLSVFCGKTLPVDEQMTDEGEVQSMPSVSV
jgi:hypothetical protein